MTEKIDYLSNEMYSILSCRDRIRSARFELETLPLPEDKEDPEYESIASKRRRLHGIIHNALRSLPYPKGYEQYATKTTKQKQINGN